MSTLLDWQWVKSRNNISFSGYICYVYNVGSKREFYTLFKKGATLHRVYQMLQQHFHSLTFVSWHNETEDHITYFQWVPHLPDGNWSHFNHSSLPCCWSADWSDCLPSAAIPSVTGSMSKSFWEIRPISESVLWGSDEDALHTSPSTCVLFILRATSGSMNSLSVKPSLSWKMINY